MKKSLLLLTFAVLASSGCAALSKFFASAFQKPTLRFHSAQLADVALSGLTLQLTYALDNPNSFGLSLAEVDYALFVDGKQVVAGQPPNGLQIPARGSARLVFPANIKFADIAPVVQTFLTKDYATYRAQGHVGINTPIGILKFPLEREDQFEVPKIPQVALAPPRITQLTLSGATVEVPLTVTNRNSFELPVQGLGGSVSIAGATVGSVSSGNLGALPGKGTRSVTLPVNINFLSAAKAATALRSGAGQVAFNGQIHSGGVAIPVNFSQNLSFRR
ncbi:MAG: LEA type 2 family protein [Myxococcota bacterium]